jgi:DNA repair protein RecO (recombination protein O)
MGLVETEGLILKSYSLAEADKIVVFLSQNQGLVRGVAKGAKRLKSKFGGSLEPFSIVQITYFQKEERELVSISQIELVKSYFENAADPEFFQKFAYISELLTEFAPPHDPNERLYRMIKKCLETAAENPQSLESVVLYFELWLLRLCGYLPDWSYCENCGREFGGAEKSNLQISFQLLCQQCSATKSKFAVSPEKREIFNAAQKIAPDKFVNFTKDKLASVKDVSAILRRIISGILGKDTISEKVFVAARER